VLKLYGFAASNYHNKVKLALLEKNIPFEEILTWTSQDADLLTRSPMGKIPFIEDTGATIVESQVIVEYLEERYPEPALYPNDPAQRAKVREIIQQLELYLEWPARRLYLEALFGGQVSDATKAEVRSALDRGVKAFTKMVKFSPFIAGNTFTYADCAAFVHIPNVSNTTKTIYGVDMLAVIPGLKEYTAMLRQRPHCVSVNAERKTNTEIFLERRKKK